MSHIFDGATPVDVSPDLLREQLPRKFADLAFVQVASQNPNGRTTIYVRVPLTITLKQLWDIRYWPKDAHQEMDDVLNGGEDWSRPIWFFCKNDYLVQTLTALTAAGGCVVAYEHVS